VLALLATSSAFAQYEDEIELTRAIIQTERQALIAAAMELTDAEREPFWPLYRSYREEMNRVGDREVRLITDYAKNFDNLSEAQAEQMLDEFMAIQQAQLKVRKQYVKKFRKILPPKKVTLFFQLENKFDSVINYELAAEVPLVQ
jgi:hypothetical protein